MKTTGNTVLITGGSAGIGFEMALMFLKLGNKVIVTGRDEARMQHALESLPGVTGIISDISDDTQVRHLVTRLEAEFPDLNMVINNAGRVFVYKLAVAAGAADYAYKEMLTNYISVVNITEQLLPLLSRQPSAAIVNVSSVVAFVPGHTVATYSASKAALHSYTQSLRYSLRDTGVKVFEVMPPLVNTSLSQEIGGANGIPPAMVAAELADALTADRYEVRIGQTEQMYQLSLKSPADAFKMMNTTSR